MAIVLATGVVAALGLAAAPAMAVNDRPSLASSAMPPAYATGSTFEVPYTVNGGPGAYSPAQIDLYVKTPGEVTYSLAATDTTPETPSFSYDAAAGDGSYAFYTVAVDHVGNTESPPLLGDDGATLVDSVAPTSAAAAPATVGSGPIDVSYTAGDGGGSGVARVELWAQAPDASAYALALTDDTPDSPSFSYTPPAGDGTYSFYTVAVDRAGNREPAALAADAETTRSAAPPHSTGLSGETVVVQLPAGPSAPAVPLVAALVMTAKQTLTRVLADGIRFRLYAYRPLGLTLSAVLTPRSARSVGLRHHPGIASRRYQFTLPGLYELRLRLEHRAALHLWRARTATLILRSVVTGAAGKATSEARVRLRR